MLLNLIYTTYTIYKYGFKKWVRLCVVDGWRFLILAFFDVEGNYFVVLAYRYVSPHKPHLSLSLCNPRLFLLLTGGDARQPFSPRNSSTSGPL